MPHLLSIDGVRRTFGKHVALDDIRLDVEQGEFIALLGPSGCGKTTLLRAIAGFLSPDAGRIAIDGQDVGALPAHRRPLNTVFQNYALFPHMTVAQNVAYGPRRQGASRREAHERALEALDMVGLRDMGERHPRQMSGGQQQRVALARAIVNRPKLLLLDEPLSALDLKLRKRMQLELKHLQEKLGIAFIFVTHDQEEAMVMADRIVVMNGGRIEQVGKGEDIYLRPHTRFVADFIGEANLLDCRAAGTGMLALGSQEVPVPCAQPLPAGTLTAMLRPEHLCLLPAGAPVPAGLVSLTGMLREQVSVGSHTTLYVRTEAGQLAVRQMGMPDVALRDGDAVTMGFAPDRLHLIADAS
ncbi:Putrescine transport ATP-binding protein PotA (TC 3.A.1.11.1) [plant metagenome]|uniref:Putrescine transport ATP-binding protein PotA (TC 3.A.1.11.1) n=1 Tax=plant metagenome TaxID=1297885 RepID=A0A484RGC6_9ZZZZ